MNPEAVTNSLKCLLISGSIVGVPVLSIAIYKLARIKKAGDLLSGLGDTLRRIQNKKNNNPKI
jgi:hypothetical protein